MKMYEIYIRLNILTSSELHSLWDYIFYIGNEFSFRVSLSLEKNDIRFLDNNIENLSIMSHLIRKFRSNSYLNDKYSNANIIYDCHLFEEFKKLVFRYPNVYCWPEIGFPDDLCIHFNQRLVFYNCSHEEYSILYLSEEQYKTVNSMKKFNLDGCMIKRINTDNIPSLQRFK